MNCTRRNSRSSAAASVFTSSVLATPGTPSSRTWPRTSRAATRPDSVPSWPTTTLATSSRTACIASRGTVSGRSAMGDLLAELGEGLAEATSAASSATGGPSASARDRVRGRRPARTASGVGQLVRSAPSAPGRARGRASGGPVRGAGGRRVPVPGAGEQVADGDDTISEPASWTGCASATGRPRRRPATGEDDEGDEQLEQRQVRPAG